MRKINGKELAQEVLSKAKLETASLKSPPRLDIIFVGTDPASATYVKVKAKTGKETGINVNIHRFSGQNPDVAQKIKELGADKQCNAIIVQLPLPKRDDKLLELIPPAKDVDGLNPLSLGKIWQNLPALVPATPAAIMYALEHIAKTEGNADYLSGKTVLVINRSVVIGRPLAALLLQKDCTVTIAHSKTKNLPELLATADIVITGTGQTGILKKEYLKQDAVVIDAGFSIRDGKIKGDVNPDELEGKAGWLSPVPGGIGPLGVAMLLMNTVTAAKNQSGL